MALASLSAPQTVHDPGRVLTDLAVAIADGAECISDIAALVDQPGLFGPVASDTTVWRLLERLDRERQREGAAARGLGRRTGGGARGRAARQPVPPGTPPGHEGP